MSVIHGPLELELESTLVELLDESGTAVEVEVQTYVYVEDETELLLDLQGGAPGLNAYQVAVQNGFVGSVQDWLLSLRGAQGSPGAPGTGQFVVVTLQQSVASAVWEFSHTFAYRPDVETFDQNGEPIEGDVSYPTPTTVRVSFGFAMTGSIQLS